MTESVSMIHNRFRRQAMIWLIVAGIMAVLWLLISLMNQAPTIAKESKKTQAAAEDFALPVSIDNLNELSKEVIPIDFETVVRDLRNYPAEFKGKRYFKDNESRWTVQVMEVEKHEVITEYLNRRDDRDKFAYFRYHNSNNEQRYILTYGIMGSTQEALGAIKTVDFGLPKQVEPMPEEMRRYLSIMDDYERAEMIVDNSEATPRAIKLKPTKKEIPAEAPKKEEEEVMETGRKMIAEEADTTESVTEDNGVHANKLKAPPTAVPKETDNVKADKTAKKAETKTERGDTKSESRPEAKSESKPKNEPKSEPKPEPKESKPEPKHEKPASTKEANVADLEPAPPMSNGLNLPGDD